MYYKELSDKMTTALGIFVANIRRTSRSDMDWLSEAQQLFQNEAQLMNRIDSVTIPANTSSVNYSFRWEPKQLSVRDNVNKIDYGIRSYDQFMDNSAYLNPQQNSNARVSPIIPIQNNESQGYLVSFENRVLRVYPTPTTDLVLDVHYVPLLPAFSMADPYWLDWFAFQDTVPGTISNVATSLTTDLSHSGGSFPCMIQITDGTNTDVGTCSGVSGTTVSFTRTGTLHAFGAGATVTVYNGADFKTNFTTLTPEREFFPYLTGFVEYAVEKYLSAIVYNKEAAARLELAHDNWTKQLESAKRHKPVKGRFYQAAYSGPTRL